MNSQNSMETKITIPEYDFKSLYPYTKTLSSSQILLYEEDPAAFYTEYVLGVRRAESVAMKTGSIFSELHRNREYDFKTALAQAGAPKRVAELFARVIAHFPVVPAEVALVADVGNGWKVRATLDGYVESEFVIIENKTGQREWTQERVNFSDQITCQSFVHWKLKGVTPKRILLNWVNTAASAKQPLVSFKTSRTSKALQMFERRVEAVIAGIEAGNWTQPIYANQ